MDRKRIVALLVPVVTLAACGQPDPQAVTPSPTPTVTAPSAPATPASPTPPPAEPTPAAAATPAAASPTLTPDAERGETGARDVLLDFARAIELGRVDQAWALLSPADRRKWTRPAFRALFADLDRPTVAVPTGVIEGAAGSSYYTAPVTITGTDRSGRPVRIEGEAVLRRVNDVDGSTPAQRRWHFQSLSLDWTH
ncbi:hypothetical protein [Sphingomonas sp.]|uniref:hypothetical protein n=1 Tax=Sphingomonas sp. TaxID=28214 RepID=UPI003F721CDE